MADRLHDIDEEKSVNIALATGIIIIIILTLIQLVSDVLRQYIPSYTPWLEKVVVIVIFYLFLRYVSKNHEYVLKLEKFLLLIFKKKK